MELFGIWMLAVNALVIMLVRSRIVGAQPSPMPVTVVVQPRPRPRSGHGVGRW